jgi:hypothetical protein
MRRVAALALVVLPLLACSGEQGERAQQLLTRAQAAQARLTSATYEARMSVSMDGQRFGLVMDGGAYLKGPRAGDQILSLRADGIPGVGAMDMQMLVRGRVATMSLNGQRFSVPLPASTKEQYDWSSTMLDLARYVKQVKVREGRVVNGEPGATIAGVIDTEGLLKAVSKLEPFTQAAGPAAPDFGEIAEHLGDIRAAVFVAQGTGLIRSAVINLAVDAQGKKAQIEFTYRLNSSNKAVPGL